MSLRAVGICPYYDLAYTCIECVWHTHIIECHIGVHLAMAQQGQVPRAVHELEGGGDLSVGEAVERKVRVLGDGVGVVDTQYPLAHHDGPLLEDQRL